MSAALIIYLAELFSKTTAGLGFVSFVAFLVSVISFVVMQFHRSEPSEDRYDNREYEVHKRAKRSLKISLLLLIPAFSLCVIIPSGQTVYLMAGAKISQDIITAPETKEIGNKLLKVINTKLDEQLKEEKK